MITAQQAAAETIVGSQAQAEKKQERLIEAVDWAFTRIKRSAEIGQYGCTLPCEYPLGGSQYSSRWSHEFAKKVALHIRNAGFKVRLVRLLVLASWIRVSWDCAIEAEHLPTKEGGDG